MRKVIDTNFLGNQSLAEFLSQKDNVAVLTEYSAIENYKSGRPEDIIFSMRILSEHSKKVLILKHTIEVCQLENWSSPQLPHRLIDEQSTKDFTLFCEELKKAETGNPTKLQSIKEHSKAAQKHMARIQADAKLLIPNFTELAKSFAPKELTELTHSVSTNDITEELFYKIIDTSISLTRLFMEELFQTKRPPPPADFHNYFLFRYSLAIMAFFVHWTRGGRQSSISHEKIVNTIPDINFAVWATYFDGILSRDKILIVIYNETMHLLNRLPSLRNTSPPP